MKMKKVQINISENIRATALSKMCTIQRRMLFTADSWIAYSRAGQ